MFSGSFCGCSVETASKIDEDDQYPGALYVAQEPMTETLAVGSTFDETRNIGDDKFKIVLHSNHTKVGFKRGEGIISNLWFRRRDPRNESGLADIREADKSNISHQFKFEVQPLFFSDLALFGKRRCSANIGKELGVALPASATGRRHPAIAMMNKVGQHLALEIMNDCAFRDMDDQVIGASSVHLFSLTMGTARGPSMGMVLESEK